MIDADLQKMNDILDDNPFQNINTLQYVITTQSKQELELGKPKQYYIKQYFQQGIMPIEVKIYFMMRQEDEFLNDFTVPERETPVQVKYKMEQRQGRQERTEYSNNSILKSSKQTKKDSSKRVTFEYPESTHTIQQKKKKF